MATLVQDPCPTMFVGDMTDMILSSQDSLDFILRLNGVNVLREHYSPASGSIRIGGLDAVLDSCLYGELMLSGRQSALGGTVQFVTVEGETETVQLTKKLVVSHQRNHLDPGGTKKILSHGRSSVCYPGVAHPLTFTARGTARLFDDGGSQLATATVGTNNQFNTVNCDPALLFPSAYSSGAKMVFSVSGDTFESHIDHRSYPDKTVFRFLNIYDAPEVLVAKVGTKVKPGVTENTGMTYGEERRYSVVPNDEYSCDSGRLQLRSEYLQWYDLLVSRRVEVLVGSAWIPVIVSKANYQQSQLRSSFERVEFSFRTARKKDALMMEN